MKKTALALVLAILTLPALFAAPNFPVKPVEVVVGFAAGGGTHLAAELLTVEAPKFLGQPIQMPISLYMDSVDFGENDFVGLALASDVAPLLAVRADAPFNSAKEMKDWIAANPGKFSWSHPGVGSTLHVLGANMLYALGVTKQVKEVPFRGTNEGISAVLGGHVTAVSSFPATVLEQVRAGKMKVIGVSAPKRIPELPNAPTFLEQGFKATLTSTRGIFAPAKTPKDVLGILDKAFAKIIQSEDFQKRAIKLGEPAVYADAATFNEMYRDQLVMIKALLKEIGLTK
ncbi:MAG: hypothetical protein FD137_1080 [Spirochaetes bacterium]|nr:MAG: hypothetical protein FD137_1080 [Spirochaetota bacterium]